MISTLVIRRTYSRPICWLVQLGRRICTSLFNEWRNYETNKWAMIWQQARQKHTQNTSKTHPKHTQPTPKTHPKHTICSPTLSYLSLTPLTSSVRVTGSDSPPSPNQVTCFHVLLLGTHSSCPCLKQTTSRYFYLAFSHIGWTCHSNRSLWYVHR